LPIGQLDNERAEFLFHHSARQADLLDLALAQVARESHERGGGSRQPLGIHDHVVADEADDERLRRLQQVLTQRRERVDAALHERMRRRVQGRAPRRRRHTADEIIQLVNW
jgi:hypothetical protein